jgi:hypothetical protein
MPKAKKMGRPKLPKGHAKSSILPIRLNDHDRKRLDRMVKASEHDTVSLFARASLGESMRETNIHQILDDFRKGKSLDYLSEIDIQDIRHFNHIDTSAYRTDDAPVYGTRTTARDIRDLQRISKALPS